MRLVALDVGLTTLAYNPVMPDPRCRVLVVQLPIPPLGPGPIRGNVPLAGAYLKPNAEAHGLGHEYAIDIFPTGRSNDLGDRAFVAELKARDSWLVGFTCYLWEALTDDRIVVVDPFSELMTK